MEAGKPQAQTFTIDSERHTLLLALQIVKLIEEYKRDKWHPLDQIRTNAALDAAKALVLDSHCNGWPNPTTLTPLAPVPQADVEPPSQEGR